MSGSSSAAASTSSPPAVAISRRKRPRHFHQGGDEAGQEKAEREETAAAAAQPPVARLYKHALESIFDFLSLKELSSVLAVSHSWQSAVGSMRSIDASVKCPPAGRSLLTLSASRLARHIGTLGSKSKPLALSQESLYLQSLRMIGLHTLYYKLSLLLDGPLIFPPNIARLEVTTDHWATATPAINALIAAASRLPLLVRFSFLGVGQLDPLVSFAPLLRSPLLRELDLPTSQWSFTQAQADDLRAMPQLLVFSRWLDAPTQRQLLRVPHQLQCRASSFKDRWTASSLACWPCFPRSRGWESSSHQPLVSPGQIVAGVSQLKQLTQLTITRSQLTAAHMAALVSLMLTLSRLHLSGLPELESLSFLSSEPLQRSLTILTLADCRNRALLTMELHHIFTLQQLTHLAIQRCFVETLNSFLVHELTPPSARLPKLVKSKIIDE